MPNPIGFPPPEVGFDSKTTEGAQRQSSLNVKQKKTFLQIMAAINDENASNRCFLRCY